MTKQFCVFGNPIAHSLSPLMHNYAFHHLREELGFVGSYGRVLLENPLLLKDKFLALGLDGANITTPFKEEAFRQCECIDPLAHKIRAINTWVKKDGVIHGYNTDAMGFYETIKDFGFRSALVLGSGGAARAVAYGLLQKGLSVSILARKLDSTLARDFENYTPKTFTPHSHELIINATSASLQDSLPFDAPLLREIFKSAKYAYDLAYSAQGTPFLRLASEFVPAQDGKMMLIAQGVLAFELFCGRQIPRAAILMRQALN